MNFSPKILIVDDEKALCESLRILLARQGFDAVTANSGKDAIDMLTSQSFDLVLLDLVIPDLNGFQILDQINFSKHDAMTIVFTGDASVESAVTALKKGAYDYLKKPFEYEELLRRVGNALEQKKLLLEKKVVGEKLKRSEKRWHYLVQYSPDIIYVLDSYGNFSFTNITLNRLLGYPEGYLNGKHFSTFVHDTDLKVAINFMRKKASGHDKTSTSILKLKRYDDNRLFKLFEVAHNSIQFTPNDGGEFHGTYGVARDVTYRQKLEEKLTHAKKIEAIGALAGGIAHDFNNILMGIMGYTSLLLTNYDKNDPDYSKIRCIEEYVKSGANLTKQLLSFARKGEYNLKPCDLNQIIEKTSTMFARTRKELKLECISEADNYIVEIDEGQIEQVLINLYVNAWQAMPEGGYLYITVKNVLVDNEMSVDMNLPSGKYVYVEIRDTGIGMDEEIQKKIFEPFFTTKSGGNQGGTGLGLAFSYGIIANHGGIITMNSKKGSGTAFIIYLPASEKSLIEETCPSGDIMTGAGTVLLVDDEKIITDVGFEMLESIGYKTIIAANGRDAINIYSEKKEEIDIVIVDLIMPEMGGEVLCNEIRYINPNAIILLSSGYDKNGEAMEKLKHKCNGFIQKPFSIKKLSQKLHEILA